MGVSAHAGLLFIILTAERSWRKVPGAVRLILKLTGERCQMAKPNYAFAKRQRDLAKKQKKEEKRLRKAGTTDNQPEE